MYLAEHEMILDGKEITYQSFKEIWFGADQQKQMVLEVFKQHNEEFALLVGKDYAPDHRLFVVKEPTYSQRI
ncbi:MAG: hypothetical protein ABIU77_22320 [Ferruginibacter sp.]